MIVADGMRRTCGPGPKIIILIQEFYIWEGKSAVIFSETVLSINDLMPYIGL